MKNLQPFHRIKYLHWIQLLLPGLILLTIWPVRSVAENTDVDKPFANLEIEYLKNQEDDRSVTVTLITWENGQIVYLGGQQVALYLNEISESELLARLITDQDGKGALHLSEEEFRAAAGQASEFTLIAGLDNSDSYLSEIIYTNITEAGLFVEFFEEDSVRYVKAKVGSYDESMNFIPAEYIEVKFYVQRMLGELPIGGDYTFTDENGEIIIEFPDDLSGSRDGNLEIIVKVEDHEDFGNLVYTSSKEWGVPLDFNRISSGRSWIGSRANAPVILIIISNLIILGVWIIIIYLVVQIVRIRKLNNRKTA